MAVCSENKISSLDVSKNVKLEKLHCNKNALTSIDVSKNVQLTGLDCSANKLKTIDVSKNTVLEWLYCFDNSIKTFLSSPCSLIVLFRVNISFFDESKVMYMPSGALANR